MGIIRAVAGAIALLCLYSAAAGAVDARPGSAPAAAVPAGAQPSRTCNAAPGDAEGFKAALRNHEQARVGFRHKMRSRYYATPKNFKAWFDTLEPAKLLAAVTDNLRNLDHAGGTVALVYDSGTEGGSKRLCTWLITRDGIAAAQNSDLPDEPLATALRTALTTDPETYDEALRQTANVVLPDSIARAIGAQRPRRILVLPVGDIGTLPFPALPVGGAALIENAAVMVLPDIEALYLMQPYGYEFAGGPKLIVGDPAFDPRKQAMWGPIPETGDEARHAHARFGGTLLVQRQATKPSVMRAIKAQETKLQFLYFATHGIADAVNPMDASLLVLAGDELRAEEIKKFRLDGHPIVVMSACQTGLGKVFDGGVFGLARAWHYAGAVQVVMSLWDVEDAATRQLMGAFVDGLDLRPNRQAGAPEVALRSAMLKVRAELRHPALWGAFMAYGLPMAWME